MPAGADHACMPGTKLVEYERGDVAAGVHCRIGWVEKVGVVPPLSASGCSSG
ncbi:MAG: hypothetical protein WBQ57_02420 [Rhodanobacteraceae bacterium]